MLIIFIIFLKVQTSFIANNKKKRCRANTKRKKHQKTRKSKKVFIAARQNRFNSFKVNKFMGLNLHSSSYNSYYTDLWRILLNIKGFMKKREEKNVIIKTFP